MDTQWAGAQWARNGHPTPDYRMYWEEDAAWYTADVVNYDPAKGQHELWYHLDENREWIDLKGEEEANNVQVGCVPKWHLPAKPGRHQCACILGAELLFRNRTG